MLSADCLVLHDLERVLREVVGMKVRLEELVRRAGARASESFSMFCSTTGSLQTERALRMKAAISCRFIRSTAWWT